MGDPPAEVQAAQQVASALLMRKAGTSTLVPSWLVNGFGRATYYRMAPQHPAVAKERRTARGYAVKNKRKARDVWASTLEGEEYNVLAASVADFLAYGPGKTKFVAFLDGFKPGENVPSKTVEQALTSANLKADTIDKRGAPGSTTPADDGCRHRAGRSRQLLSLAGCLLGAYPERVGELPSRRMAGITRKQVLKPWKCLHTWRWPWSSKPVGGLKKAPGGFDSHTLP